MTRARDVANLIGSGNYSSTTFTATAGQTAFTISHTQGFVQVFMNGLLLDETADYTSNGSAVTLTSGAAAGDEIEVVKYNTFSVGDAIPASGGTFTGNVGFGAAPTRQVHIAGNPSIMLMEDTGGGTNDKKAQLQVDSGVFEVNSRNDDNSSLKDNILTAQLDTGNIGIGTSSPDSTLTMSDTVPIIKFIDSDDSTFSRVYHSAGTLVFDADKGNTGSSSNILFTVDDTERFRFGTSGQLGIGGANYGSSGQYLKSNGSGSPPTWATVSTGYGQYDSPIFYNITASGTITTYNLTVNGNFNNYSDDRLKVKSSNIPEALSKISQINGFYYTDSDAVTDIKIGLDAEGNQAYLEKTTSQKVGVSAQELEAVLPEVVSKLESSASATNTEYLGVDYTKIVPLLIEGIKELKTKVETLETKVAALEGG